MCRNLLINISRNIVVEDVMRISHVPTDVMPFALYIY